MRVNTFSASIAFAAVLFFHLPGNAKVRVVPQSVTTRSATLTGIQNIRNLEARMRPFLEERLKRRNGEKIASGKRTALLESDIFLMAKSWSSLSTEFKNLYLSSIAIPKSALSYKTPGGHFEIFYFTEGDDKVESSDSYGFSDDNWRTRTSSANGIPDYIDETGFALDSSWEMEVNRFGFVAPHAYKDSDHTSDRYKVLVEQQAAGYYGITYLYEAASDGETGFSSYISLRNSWDSAEWADQGYDKRPLDGVRVTCAHEFFHAIQYSMSWRVKNSIWLDNFPLSWTEGSAVSMEELAFDSIDDFHQYATHYFDNPDMGFLKNETSEIVYSNTLLFLYLYQHPTGGEGIDFLKAMLYNNYDEENLAFDENLLNAGKLYGSSWSAQFHAFHCASLFSGRYADTERFITDADSFPEVSIPPVTEIQKIERSIAANSVYFMRFGRKKDHADTISLSVSSAFKPDTKILVHKYPLYSVLLSTEDSDSLIPVISDEAVQSKKIRITNWDNWDTLTLIVTNANPIEIPDITIQVQPYPVTYTKNTVIRDTLDDTQSGSSAILRITALQDLHEDYTFTLSHSMPDADKASGQQFSAVSPYYTVTVPGYWDEDASLHLSLFTNISAAPSDSFALAVWSIDSMQWEPIVYAQPDSSDAATANASGSISGSGIYALVKKSGTTSLKKGDFVAFPNPMSLKRHKGTFKFRGGNISRIKVYSLDGTLVYALDKDISPLPTSSIVQTYQWNPAERSAPCSPGTYTVLVEQYDPAKQSFRRTRKKVMITP